ncbi:MAG: cell division protein SepF [Nitriliruptorales bacterium]|nr:cell division protein SepF [Nitriliruptorales bacterium]
MSVWRKTLIYLGLVEETEAEDLPQRFGGDEPAAREREQQPVHASNVRPLRVPEPGAAHVRAQGGRGRVAVVDVVSFDDAAEIGAQYRAGHPVLFDLSGLDRGEARRILDFVSGVTYALHGRLRKAGARAFVLAPDGVELGADELDRLASLGYEPQA